MIPTLHTMATIAYENKEHEKDLKYELQAYQLAMETGDAMGLFRVGLRLGQILYAMGKKEEGIKILQRSYQVGKQANFPNIEAVEKILNELGALE